MTINNNETETETEKKDISKFKVIIKRTFGNIRLTRKNLGWWFLSLLILILLIGAIRTLIVPDSNYFDVLLIILDWFLLLFGLSLETIDYRAPIIFRGLATAAYHLILVLSV